MIDRPQCTETRSPSDFTSPTKWFLSLWPNMIVVECLRPSVQRAIAWARVVRMFLESPNRLEITGESLQSLLVHGAFWSVHFSHIKRLSGLDKVCAFQIINALYLDPQLASNVNQTQNIAFNRSSRGIKLITGYSGVHPLSQSRGIFRPT